MWKTTIQARVADRGCCHTGTYGHFAQAVWSITRYIGCGVVTHQGGLGTKAEQRTGNHGCSEWGEELEATAQAQAEQCTGNHGCSECRASRKANSDRSRPVLLYCNYGPGGNVVSKPTYRMGRTCSACPQGTKCNSRYEGLCNVAS
ncbi:venom allergen 5-like [Pollicipes pollicipes]|uniref:venom allergen 5-like n=1 Tax=Pollicipes pollicipes TaxID=41117 RepID=UPI0018850064|nr:venom allergen 5-like [Pollicipes pollicipes]